MGVQRKNGKNGIPKRRVATVIGFLIPVLTFSFLIGSGLGYLGTLNNYFVNEIEVDTDEFIEPNASFLASAAENWSRISRLYCMPENLTGDGWDYYPIVNAKYQRNPISYNIHNESELLRNADIFDPEDPFNQLYTYSGGGHAPAYCGITLIGEALKYAVSVREGDDESIREVGSTVLQIVRAFHLLSDIDPDGRMARLVLPDTQKARDSFKFFDFTQEWTDTHLRLNLTYNGPNGEDYVFWLETGTSVDLYLAVLAGLGFTYRFVNNATIRGVIRDTVDTMLEFCENCGWKFVDIDGRTHLMGAEAINSKPFTDAGYCLAFLIVGKTVNPDRWAPLYEEYARDRLFARKVGKQTEFGFHYMFSWAAGYFNIDLMMIIAGCLTVLETDPQLDALYKQFLNKVYSIIKYHRNAWFDSFYALGMSSLEFDVYDSYIGAPNVEIDSETYNYLVADVADCLMRCAEKKKTGRRFLNPICNDSYDQYQKLSPIKGAGYPDVQYYEWEETVSMENPVVKLLSDLYSPDHAWTHRNGIWDTPIPADWRRTTTFMWEYSPFDTILNTGYTGIEQCPTGDFTTPYWIARYLDFPGFSS